MSMELIKKPFSFFSDALNNVYNKFVYISETYVEEEENIEKKIEKKVDTIKEKPKTISKASTIHSIKISGGSDIFYEIPNYKKEELVLEKSKTPVLEKSNLKILSTKKFNISTFKINSFNEVEKVADKFIAGNVILVNFDKVDQKEQNRICDFLNGVCYVHDGSAMAVTNTIILYAPCGIRLKSN